MSEQQTGRIVGIGGTTERTVGHFLSHWCVEYLIIRELINVVELSQRKRIVVKLIHETSSDENRKVDRWTGFRPRRMVDGEL